MSKPTNTLNLTKHWHVALDVGTHNLYQLNPGFPQNPAHNPTGMMKRPTRFFGNTGVIIKHRVGDRLPLAPVEKYILLMHEKGK